ncbi:MAG: TIR domain-containing protein [Opitutae bacterium]|nr:TIR domain-containing protein [Opitutae bacterium]
MTPPDTATPAPKPTLFLSYASDDRDAARRLRDSLAAAGLDVWYDESELGGGDAWDQKIRRQIRECDYFMPVISASTERRKEGYFRREWRLATERTLDMADDVMFLLPVCIDGTTENSARVPEKFLTVQWLRAPGGDATPALETFARRLAAGEHLAPTPPRGRSEPPVSHSAAHRSAPHHSPPPLPAHSPAPHGHGSAPHDGPPPMPSFPHLQGKGMAAGLKFLAEVLWWIVTAAWLLSRRAPKWIRALVLVWLVFSLFSYCSRATRSSNKEPKPAATKSLSPAELQTEIAKARQALNQSGLPTGIAALGDELAKRLSAEIKNSDAADKQIVAVPFAAGIADPADAKLLADVFMPLWGRLSIERSGDTALIATPLPAPTNETLAALGKRLDAGFVLGARLVRTAAPAVPATAEPSPAAPANGEATLEVVLLRGEDGSLAWSQSFPLKDSDPNVVATQIADAVLKSTPAK